MRVLLINPPFYRLMRVRHRYFPLGLGYIAAAARQAGFATQIYDMEKDSAGRSFATNLILAHRRAGHQHFLEALQQDAHPVWEEARATLRNTQPDIVGISIWTTVYPVAQKIAALVRRQLPAAVIVAGGIHATVCDREVAADPLFDIVVRGEGEHTFVELLYNLNRDSAELSTVAGITYRRADTICATPDRTLEQDIDSLPLPARDAVLFRERFTPRDWGCVSTARGCPFHCTFCSSHALWGRTVRARRIENVSAELHAVYMQRGVRFYTIFDDTFTLSPARVRAWCDYIISRRLFVRWFAHGRLDTVDGPLLALMKRGGCYALQFGVESGQQSRLDALRKGIDRQQALTVRQFCRQYKILFWATFLIGTPGETVADLCQTEQLLTQLQPDLVNMNAYVPYPGASDWRARAGAAASNWHRYAPQSPLTNFSGLPEPEWRHWRARLESTADNYNRRTLRSWRWWWRGGFFNRGAA